MAKQSKTYKDYNEYLNSPKWEQVKQDFYNEYDGYTNVCEISGITSDNMNLHHWRYESDWNNDSSDNVILVCKQVHEWIHGRLVKQTDTPHNYFSDVERKMYICEAIAAWIKHRVEALDNMAGSALFERELLEEENKVLLEQAIKKDELLNIYSELAWRLKNE